MYKPKDHYFLKAKQEDYPARSIYKLEEIARRYGLLKPGYRVLDLGSAPGSWLKYAAQKVGATGVAVGVDLKPLNTPLPLQAYFLQRDVFSIRPEDMEAYAPNFEVILSDMAPATTGIRLADEQNSLDLARRALDLAQTFLVPGGSFLVKLFEGQDFPEFLGKARNSFQKVQAIRPQATRKGSREIFVLGLDFLKK